MGLSGRWNAGKPVPGAEIQKIESKMNTETCNKTDALTKTYRIRVEGSLDPSWSGRLGGLTITSTGKFGSRTTTVLEGELPDQGALLGLLNTLYEMHLVLENVETIPSDAPARTGQAQRP
jgi:hypothetical protein